MVSLHPARAMGPGERPASGAGRSIRAAVLALVVAVTLAVANTGARPVHGGGGLLAAWVQLGPDGVAIARAVLPGGVCPALLLDGRAAVMQQRAGPTADFPVLVCEAAIPPATAAASVEGLVLPLPRPDPRRILVVGDTGCRLAAERGRTETQACNDPSAWPWARVAETAAAWQPDLIIHAGDLLYREAPCPAGNAGCAGSPWGYNWPANDADFFTPAAPLLRAAPWVFVRGNHELCERNGAAWFRFFEPRPAPARCEDYTEPYAIPAGGLQLLVLDSSNADDYVADPAEVPIYRRQFEALAAAAGPNAWLLSHRPVWAVGHDGEADGVEKLFYDNPTLQAASGNALPPGVGLVLSGHLHSFETLSFGPARPPQMIVGNSGTALDQQITTPLDGLTVAGLPVASGRQRAGFGFTTMEREGTGWQVTPRGPRGAAQFACLLLDRSLTCDPEPRRGEPRFP